LATVALVCALVLAVLDAGAARASEKRFPKDSGIVDVKAEYGAKGDGRTDDTAAIRRAIQDHIDYGTPKTILYFPKGTYLVSGSLEWKDQAGSWKTKLTFQGQDREETVIKLKDGAAGFGDPARPEAVVHTASLGPNRPDGGGNRAHRNYVLDLTVDTGRGNPGAVGIDYLANNQGAIRDVTIRSGDGRGRIGLALTREWPGPCLIQDVSIKGFDYGIYSKTREYGATLERISLSGQRLAGIRNEDNVLSIRGLASTNSVPAVQNATPAGLVTLLDATLDGGSSRVSAVENNGALYARNVRTMGYASAVSNRGSAVPGAALSEWSSGPSALAQGSLKLPVAEAPAYHDNDLADWADVRDFGAIPNDGADDTAAIQRAIDSGKTTVYLPTGYYRLSDTIRVRGQVRKVAGMQSRLEPYGNTAFGTKPFVRVEKTASAVVIDALDVEGPSGAGIEHASPQVLVVRDSTLRVPVGYRNTPGVGRLFLENVVGGDRGTVRLYHPQEVWARQLNLETNALKVHNRGARLWILGLKTENRAGPGSPTVIETTGGGKTELLGGLLYPVQPIPSNVPAFVNNESSLSLIYAVSAYGSADRNYNVHVRETRNGVTRDLTRSALASRGYGSLAPFKGTQPAGATGGGASRDGYRPTVSGMSPAPNSKTRDRTPTVRAVVRDRGSDLARANIKLYVDGRARRFSYRPRTDRLAYTTGRLEPGRHTAKVVATDPSGNRSTRTWRFKVVRTS